MLTQCTGLLYGLHCRQSDYVELCMRNVIINQIESICQGDWNAAGYCVPTKRVCSMSMLCWSTVNWSRTTHVRAIRRRCVVDFSLGYGKSKTFRRLPQTYGRSIRRIASVWIRLLTNWALGLHRLHHSIFCYNTYTGIVNSTYVSHLPCCYNPIVW